MDIVIRAAVTFVLLFLVLRILGRRDLGDMEPFDLVFLIVLGNLVTQGVMQEDLSFTGSMLAVLTFTVLTIAVSYGSYRFRRLRPTLEGEPIVLIENGRLIERNMARERIAIEDLQAEARKQQMPSLDQVGFAVLETGGAISFVPKSAM